MAARIRQAIALPSTNKWCANPLLTTNGSSMTALHCVKLVKTYGNGGGGSSLAVLPDEFQKRLGITLDFIPFPYQVIFSILYFYEYGLKIINVVFFKTEIHKRIGITSFWSFCLTDKWQWFQIAVEEKLSMLTDSKLLLVMSQSKLFISHYNGRRLNRLPETSF